MSGTTTWRAQVGKTVYVVTGVPCDDAKEIAYASIVRVRLLIAARIIELGAVGPEAFQYLRNSVELLAEDLTALLDVAHTTVGTWETGKHPVPRMAWATLASMVYDALGMMSRTDAVLRAAALPRRPSRRVELAFVADVSMSAEDANPWDRLTLDEVEALGGDLEADASVTSACDSSTLAS